MDWDELGQMWLRDRARELATAASNCDRAYTRGKPMATANRVAEAYRRAAQLLRNEVKAWEWEEEDG